MPIKANTIIYLNTLSHTRACARTHARTRTVHTYIHTGCPKICAFEAHDTLC